MDKRALGRWGEKLIARRYACPRCKRFWTLRRLPINFRCADIICDFCGYLVQVKTLTVRNPAILPRTVLGAAWGPQRERMKAGVYFPLFFVARGPRRVAVYSLPTELQLPALFRKRRPLSARAKRSGWQGFYYDLHRLGPGLPLLIDVLTLGGKPVTSSERRAFEALRDQLTQE